jgi:hypothetical protein
LLYGNTDSLMFEITLSDAQRAAGNLDARQLLYSVLRDRMDVSNVPSTSTFWDRMPAEWKESAKDRMGEWGCAKEETGMAGMEAFVVNGPNRWGAKIIQSATDTMPSQTGSSGDTVLKTLSKTFVGASLDEYASNWGEGGGVGVCTWGNTACLVDAGGCHWPIGTDLPEVREAMAWKPSSPCASPVIAIAPVTL